MSILQIFDTGSGYKLVNPEATETGGTTGGTSGNVSLDLTTSRNFEVTASGSITWTFANAPSGSRLTTTFKLVLINGGLGSQTWPAAVTWLSGSVPTLKSAGTNILQFTTTNNGTSWLAADITPSSAPSITASNVLTGFSLDTGSLTTFDFLAIRTGAGASTDVLRFQYSNNGGTTWTNFTNMASIGASGLVTPSFGQYRFYYLAGSWHHAVMFFGRNTNNQFFFQSDFPLIPTASTIYRINKSGGTWTYY